MNIKGLFERKIILPQTEAQFESLVATIVKKYKLPNKDHAAAVIANRIMHLPPEQATTTLQYLGHCVLKNISFQLAKSQGSKAAHISQVDELFATLTADKNDQQARDALEKAANEGSPYAKEALNKLDGIIETAAAVSNLTLVQSQGEDTAHLTVSPEPA